MKNKNLKKGIFVGISVVLIIIISIILIKNNKNKLTVLERKWIDDNTTSILNINIPNNIPVFATDGNGVFYDFLEDFSAKYDLKLNPITYNYKTNPSGVSFKISKTYNKNDVVFYEDHYVLLGLNNEIINDYTDLFGKEIGLLEEDLSYVSKKINSSRIAFRQFASEEDLFNSFSEEIRYIIVPRGLFLNKILENDYSVLLHLSDINYYYILTNTKDTLTKVLSKYYKREWNKVFTSNYKENEFLEYTESLKITDAEVETLRSSTYTYAFLNSSPYDILKNRIYGGINAVLLKEFSDFSGIELNYVKYKSYKELSSAIKDKKITMYFNKYSHVDDLYNTDFGYSLKYNIILNRNNPLVIKSIYSLEGKEVYIEKNSNLINYFSSINNINIKTYSTEKELFKLGKKDVIIIIDSRNFDFYNINKLKNYTIRYTDYVNEKATFKINNKSSLYKLFNKYASLQDDNTIINYGINNNFDTTRRGKALSLLSKYILYIFIIATTVGYFTIRKTKKIKLATKIKKEDKIKYIDQLTSLKNRNYFNECLEKWNNNTIYPQAIIVVDLNNLKKINDQIGHADGDKQISAFASSLIKTQLDNSEIMRTDGNEFVIYLIGYNQKAITNYIRKLNKEVEKLPYKEGAAFGYSIIESDLKTVEDALNDALIDMRKQKGKPNEEKN